MIELSGSLRRDDRSQSMKREIRKQLLDMLKQSQIILEKAKALREESQILLENYSNEENDSPSGNDMKACRGL